MNLLGWVFLAWLVGDGDPRFEQLQAQEILEIHDALIERFGGELGVIYEGSIHFIPEKASLKRSLEAAAAVYLFEIITGHPFIDGNKRTGFAVCHTFLRSNGFYLDISVEEGKDTTLKIASGKLDYEAVVEWIKKHLKKL